MNFINTYFDKIIFIHCKHRLDRLENINLLLKKNKLTNYIILEATYLPKNGAKGCSHSHYRAMKLAIENKWNTILIIEDDFQFNDNINFKKIIESINNDWDIIMPYWSINSIEKRSTKINNLLRKVTHKKYGAYSTLCYAVNNNMIPILRNLFLKSYNMLKDIYDNNKVKYKACDTIWFSIQYKYKWYICFPKLGYTIDTKSDIN